VGGGAPREHKDTTGARATGVRAARGELRRRAAQRRRASRAPLRVEVGREEDESKNTWTIFHAKALKKVLSATNSLAACHPREAGEESAVENS